MAKKKGCHQHYICVKKKKKRISPPSPKGEEGIRIYGLIGKPHE